MESFIGRSFYQVHEHGSFTKKEACICQKFRALQDSSLKEGCKFELQGQHEH
jgi:hypothetical protein